MSKKSGATSALMNLLNSSSQDGNQYVTFSIGNEEYGIEIKAVQEITAFRKLTPLPNTPMFIRGILNLRGNVIPVLDPRIKFGLQETEYTQNSVIIIFSTGFKIVGMIVDKISDVLTIEKKNIEDTPELTVDINTKFLQGIGKVGEKFIILLDIANIVSSEDVNI